MLADKIVGKIRNKLYYVKMLVSFVVLCMIVVLTMSMVFSNMYKKSLVDSTAQEYLDSLSRVNVGIENVIRQADSLYTNMKLNKDIYIFLNSHEPDLNLALFAQNAATQTKHLNPYVHSICLYNAGLDFYVSTGYTTKINTEMDDDAFKRIMMDTEVHSKRNIQRIAIDNRNSGEDRKPISKGMENKNVAYVLSIKYKEYSIYNKLQDSILINIDEALIRKDLLNSLEGSTLLISEDGSVLMPADSEKPEDGKIIKYLADNIVSKQMVKGTVRYGSSIDTHIITYAKSEVANWYVVNIRPFSNITKSIRDKEVWLYIICFTILLTFIAISFLVSSQLYSPIRKVMESLKKRMPAAGKSNSGEFPMIANIIEEAFSKMQELTRKNDESTVVLKESLLRSLIIMGANEENSVGLMKDCPLKISFDNLIVVSVKIDNYRLQKENNIMIIETIMSSTINEVLEKKFLCETVNMYQGEICILMNFRNSRLNSFEELTTALEEMKDFIGRLIGTTVTIGIGGVANGAEECSSVYKKARDMVKFRFVLGTGKIIHERYIEENLIRGLMYPAELKEKLLIAVRLNKRQDFEATLEQIMELLSKYVYSDVAVIFLKLILDCIEAMNEITGRVKTIEFDFDEFNGLFLELLTLQHAKVWLLKLFDEYGVIVERLNSMKEDKYYKMIEDTKEFINQNYADINLGVEMLAEKMGYSHKYFSKVFKEITGSYLSDYIRQIRINKAKEFLCRDELKTNEIFKLTGFVNSSYFYTTFKNEVGMTPSEYKKFYNRV